MTFTESLSDVFLASSMSGIGLKAVQQPYFLCNDMFRKFCLAWVQYVLGFGSSSSDDVGNWIVAEDMRS